MVELENFPPIVQSFVLCSFTPSRFYGALLEIVLEEYVFSVIGLLEEYSSETLWVLRVVEDGLRWVRG